jgi:hypothetical protein
VWTDGAVYRQIHYDLAIKIKSVVMKFSCELDADEIGTVIAKYE